MALQRLVSYRFASISLHTGCLPWQKLTQKIANTYPRVQTDSDNFAFRFCSPRGRRWRATYLCLDCTKNVDKNWNINVLFIIHVNFDHAWVGHYPVMHLSILGPTTPIQIWGRDGELWVNFSPFRPQNLPHRWGICFWPFNEA